MLARFPMIQSIVKWLLITSVVILGLLVVLLGLGYLLHENEQETRQLKEKLDTVEQQKANPKKSILTERGVPSTAHIELTPVELISVEEVEENLNPAK